MIDEPPTNGPPIGSERLRSLVIVNTGTGKGKSTAAFGTMLRAVARGWKVAVIQFVKSGEAPISEHHPHGSQCTPGAHRSRRHRH